MTVRYFLDRFAIGTSAVTKVLVMDTKNFDRTIEYDKYALIHQAYGSEWAKMKVNSFKVTEYSIVIYAE